MCSTRTFYSRERLIFCSRNSPEFIIPTKPVKNGSGMSDSKPRRPWDVCKWYFCWWKMYKQRLSIRPWRTRGWRCILPPYGTLICPLVGFNGLIGCIRSGALSLWEWHFLTWHVGRSSRYNIYKKPLCIVYLFFC